MGCYLWGERVWVAFGCLCVDVIAVHGLNQRFWFIVVVVPWSVHSVLPSVSTSLGCLNISSISVQASWAKFVTELW